MDIKDYTLEKVYEICSSEFACDDCEKHHPELYEWCKRARAEEVPANWFDGGKL